MKRVLHLLTRGRLRKSENVVHVDRVHIMPGWDQRFQITIGEYPCMPCSTSQAFNFNTVLFQQDRTYGRTWIKIGCKIRYGVGRCLKRRHSLMLYISLGYDDARGWPSWLCSLPHKYLHSLQGRSTLMAYSCSIRDTRMTLIRRWARACEIFVDCTQAKYELACLFVHSPTHALTYSFTAHLPSHATAHSLTKQPLAGTVASAKMLTDDKRLRYLGGVHASDHYPVMIEYLWQTEQVKDDLWMLASN